MGLARLAALHGVATVHSPSPDVAVPVPGETVVAVLAALGVDASTDEAVQDALTRAESAAASRLLPPTVVVWTTPGNATAGAGTTGTPCGSPVGVLPPALPRALADLPQGTLLRVETEQGDTVEWPSPDAPPPDAPASAAGTPLRAPEGRSWPGLPLGVHRLAAVAADGRTAGAVLVVAPREVPQPPPRTHGFLVQLYSLLSGRSWGMGDLGDLAELATWSGRELGAGFVQINPLHAAVPGDPTDPSPYRPSSRRFPDPVHLRVEAVPEYAYVTGQGTARLAALLEQAAGLRAAVLEKDALIDRDAVWRLKREALEIVREIPLGPGRRAAYHHFLAERGQALEDHATWCALAEVHGSRWRDWPPGLRDPRSAETGRARHELIDRVGFHSWLAWLTDEQLAAASRAAQDAGMAVGIVHDLAVGVHPDGADAWAQRDAFADGMSVGAPPDAFNAHGQDWGLPPWRPDVLAASGYAPYRGLLRGLLTHAGALRIDHVMGLFRLWWVPAARTRRGARMCVTTPRRCSPSSCWRRTARAPSS